MGVVLLDWVGASNGFGPMVLLVGLLGSIWMGPTLVLVLSYSIWSKRTRPFALHFLLGALFGFAWVIHQGPEQIHEARERGLQIRSALVAYQRDQGRVPESLHDLTPEYLTKVPRTGLGFFRNVAFEYYPGAPGIGFTFGFSHEWLSLKGDWRGS